MPVIYYKDYRATDENGNAVSLKEGDNNRIRVLLSGDGKIHTVTLDYHIPAGYTLSAWVSILTALLLLLYTLVPDKWLPRLPIDRLFKIARKETDDVR